jgi:hypothetical protein
MSLFYGSDHFLIHYTDNGDNRPYQYSEQNIDPPHPDYIVQTSQILEEVYQHMIVDLAYSPPLSDAYYNGGGDGRMDVYMVDFGFYGATVIDSFVTNNTATAYMFLENDYFGFPRYGSDPLPAIRVTSAHEFYHTVQFGMDTHEFETMGQGDFNSAWIEMSATFMEEEHYDGVNDYYDYLEFFYNRPEWSLRTGTNLNLLRNLHMYASVVYPIFLADKFGPGIIKDIWDGCAAVVGPNWWLAADDAIKANSNDTLDMQDMFYEFTLWNLFTDNRAIQGSYFQEADSFDAVSIVENVYDYPASLSLIDDTLMPDNLGANYILLNNLSSWVSGLVVSFSPDEVQPWGLQVVGLNPPATPMIFDVTVNDSTPSQILIPDAADYSQIALIPSVLGGNALMADYSISIVPLAEGVFQPNGGEILYSGAIYEIQWYMESPVDSVSIELSTDNGQIWSDITESTENNLSYQWLVPNLISDSCLIRIADVSDVGNFYVSDEPFAIRTTTQNVILEPYPNPAWASMTGVMYFKSEYSIIQYPNGAEMTVKIMTIAGERVRELYKDDELTTGAVVIPWDFKNEDERKVAAGPYMAIITLEDETVVKKFVVLR